MNSGLQAALSIILAIIGVATLSVILSRNSNTSGVIKSATGGLSNLLSTAISPVSGGFMSSGFQTNNQF